MEVVFSNGVQYSVEFIKLILVVVCILNVHIKKSINTLFGLSLMSVMAVSYWFDMSGYSILYAIIAIAIFSIVLFRKRDIGFVILSYLVISIVDMVFGTICINAFQLNTQQIQDGDILAIVINSISLFFIVIISIILHKSGKGKAIQGMNKIHIVIFWGGFTLSVYLTYIQLVSMQTVQMNYRKELIISAVGITMVCSLICYLLMRNEAKNQYLAMENDMNQRLINAQNNYYTMMLKKETETKMFRHDIKQHIMCIQMLFEHKKYDELDVYLKQMDTYIRELSTKVVTGNMYIDMIIADLMEEFPDVTLEWNGKLPLLALESMDICSLFYNLLKNAFEASEKVLEKAVKVDVKMQGLNLLLVVSNYYDELKQDENNKYLSTKKENGHGYGLENIKRCVKKYNGSYIVNAKNNIFVTEIILSNVIIEG